MKRRYVLVLCALMAVLVVACSDDDGDVFVAQPELDFKNLKAKDDVLWNLEMAYNRRDLDQYKKLLDVDFVFFFADESPGGGGTPVSWERPDEIVATTNMFYSNYQDPNRVTNIDLELTYTRDGWTEIPQVDEDSWYSKEVEYGFAVQTVSGIDYTCQGLKAEFVIREVILGGETEKIWRIVRWRDIGEDG